jgi:HSP20 family protein
MISLTRYEPLVGRLDGLFDEFFRPVLVRGASTTAEVMPIRVDVRENAGAYVVQAELPGVKKEDIEIEVEGNEVTLRAQTRREEVAKDEGQKWLRVERRFGAAARRLALPQEIDDGKAQARFADGVLELTLPKKAPATGRKVQVN